MMLHQAPWQKRLAALAENHGHCEFIGAFLAPLITAVAGEVGLGTLAASTVLGTGITGAALTGDVLVGSALGAATSGLTGGNPLLGALGGGVSGAIGAFGPALGAATGIGTVGGDILAGVGGGLLSSEITGTSPLTGALTGGATGAISGVLSPAATAAGGAAGTTPGQGGSAAATAQPAGGGPAASGTGTASAFGDLSSTTALGTGGLITSPGGTGSSISGSPGAVTGGGGNIGGGGAPVTVGTVSGTTSSASTPATTGGGSFLGNLFGGGGGTSYPGWAPGTGAGAGIYTNLATGVTSDVPGASIPAGMSTAATGSTGSGILDSIKGDISKLISSPTALLAGGLLGYEMLSGGLSNNTAADQALQQQAAGAASTATMLQAPLTSGVLPVGAQSALDLSRQNMEASARSTYASMGMGDSTGQSDAFQAIAERIAAEKVGIEESLFAQAGPYAQLASSDDIAILNQQRAEDQQFTSALMSFVAALAGSKSGTPAVA